MEKPSYFHILIVLIVIAIAGFLSSGSMTGSIYYPDYGYRGYGYFDYVGFSSFLEFYEQYSFIIDAFLFLMIFLGLGQAAFGEHFKNRGGRAVYIGIGLFLSFGLLLWEEQTGFRILYHIGPLGLILGGLVILFWFYSYLTKGLDINFLTAASVIYIIFFAVLNIKREWFDFMGVFLDENYGLMYFLLFVSIVGVIVGVWGRNRLRAHP